jgi:hypothetical protein
MTTRHAANSSPQSPRWRLDNRSLLSECGVPDPVADSDRRWVYVLLHGDDYPGTRWDTSWVSPSQAARLLDRLMADISGDDGFGLLRCLRHRSSGRGA